jgi:hypothetical protein
VADARITVRWGRQMSWLALAGGALCAGSAYLQRGDGALSTMLTVVAAVIIALGILTAIVVKPLLVIEPGAVKVYGALALFHRTFAVGAGDRVVVRNGRLWIDRSDGSSKRVPFSPIAAHRADWQAAAGMLGE